MLITKSLYVDYTSNPKLAFWKQNNPSIYKRIQWLEDEEQEASIIELWQQVEDVVWDYLFQKYWNKRLDLFEDNPTYNADNEDVHEEDNDTIIIQPQYKSLFQENLEKTKQAILSKKPLIYQAGFLFNNLYVRVDYLLLNENWNYDLIEVKAKTWVRKNRTFQKVKNKNKGELESKFLEDISFQKYVINQSLKELWVNDLENIYYCYLNSEYKMIGKLNLNKLVILDKVDGIKTMILEGEEENSEVTIDDTLRHPSGVESITKTIEDELKLTEEEFNKLHPFNWSKYMEYFWQDRPFWTIFSRWIIHPVWIKTLYNKWKTDLEELNWEDIELFNKSDWSVWEARVFIDKYLHCKSKNCNIINNDKIFKELDKLSYPLCFYDYETISVPIPFINNTHSYQQVVVQYSLHKVFKDGKIEHYGWLLTWLSDEKKVNIIEIKDNKNKVDFESEKVVIWDYKDLLEEFLIDVWDDINKWSFIVWNQGFENSRNREVGGTFHELKNDFEKINDRTYDLMDIFKKGYYFDLWFQGSNSIKFVLPTLVPNMSYKDMEVPNGEIAMKILNKLVKGEYNDNQEEKEGIIKNLLLYCGQDSLAMYRIYEKLMNG